MNEVLDKLVGQWAQLGAGFSTRPTGTTPDLERLLLDTARHSPRMARLFIMAATWLHRFGDVIAKHRLRRLIEEELEVDARPVLGLLLDISQQGTSPEEFGSVIAAIEPAKQPGPLFEIERATPRLAARALGRASEISRRWNLWCEEIEFKDDALRPARWIVRHNPNLRTRADLRGDLRASILASLLHDTGAGQSELALARSAGGSRAQVRRAIRNLEVSDRVERARSRGRHGTRITLCTE